MVVLPKHVPRGGKGYHATTLEDIAEAADVTEGIVSWYFKTKQELFGAVIERYAIFLDVAELAAGVADGRDEQQLQALAAKLLGVIRE